jgi:glycosyltransferase involved in cell wall biosynthesis
MPRVSIITPVYNGEKTIAETILSVLNQTYTNWEHIIINDGSTDHTDEIVMRHKDTRIRYYSQQNLGRSNARNRGIEHSNGELLLFLDADDWLLPNALQDHIAYLDAYQNYGVSVSDGYFCDYRGNEIVRISDRRTPCASGGILETIIIDPGIIGGSFVAVVRKDIVEEYKILFNERLLIGEDWLFWIDLAQVTEFGFLNSITGMYRWYPGNTSNSVDDRFRNAQLWLVHQKILGSSYFTSLPTSVKSKFFYHVLIDLLANIPTDQMLVINSEQFLMLPPDIRASLLRLLASDYILHEENIVLAKRLIRRSICLYPKDIKNIIVYALLVFPGLARKCISLRRLKRIETRASINKGFGTY